ncbi:MAG: M28 family peptidase [Prevotella sp.]|nr:M28 family peptidase [Prevotella sp.]
MKSVAHIGLVIMAMMLSTACGGSKKSTKDNGEMVAVGPVFSADSAYAFCAKQCEFGPRTMNSEAHDRCAAWIVGQFQNYGMTVTEQRAVLKGFDGTPLQANNIIASYRPELTDRILLCAHWDSRPWADNDPDEANHTKPVMGANDGASGVAVMLEMARLIQSAQDTLGAFGVDFVCFDAEDWGTENESDSWALGAQHWAAQHKAKPNGKKYRYGILLDMVGGQGARFYREMLSCQYAPKVVERVWKAAEVAGFGSFFPQQDGSMITDDHGPVNEVAGIPCIDIIAYYPECVESGFGPTWHTVNDDMEHIDATTMKAVGQTLIQVLYSEK